ncbi:unnamed protein product [Rotaria sp. Silwood1]|nr:unnamed protein product [Rotaria sp. Silwood1]CAF5119532.1 unnamed protein product [Rotaria sp. Silwood1]
MSSSNQKSITNSIKKPKPLQVFISGPYSAGKTTIFNVAQFGKDYTPRYTIGIDMAVIPVNNISIMAFDEGGRCRTRSLLRSFHHRLSGMILVIDSTDREIIDQMRDELVRMSNEEELKNKSILIFANKQDLPNAMSPNEIHEKLNLTKLNGYMKWHLQPACAIRDEGIHEGLEWLAKSMVERTDLTEPIKETMTDLTKWKNQVMSLWKTMNVKSLWDTFNRFF